MWTLTHFCPVLHLYRNQLIDFQCKSMGWFLYHGSTKLKWVKKTNKTHDYKETVIIYLYSSGQKIKCFRSYIFHFRWNSRIQLEHQCTGKIDPNCSLVTAVSANFKTVFELGGTQKENAPETTKSGKVKRQSRNHCMLFQE